MRSEMIFLSENLVEDGDLPMCCDWTPSVYADVPMGLSLEILETRRLNGRSSSFFF